MLLVRRRLYRESLGIGYARPHTGTSRCEVWRYDKRAQIEISDLRTQRPRTYMHELDYVDKLYLAGFTNS